MFIFIYQTIYHFQSEIDFASYYRKISVGVINLSIYSFLLLLLFPLSSSRAAIEKAGPSTTPGPKESHVAPFMAPKMAVSASGEFKKWHPVTITLEGPSASETGSPNPFMDYRFEVVFSQAEKSITVPGYFAADGNAAETSATSGNIWRAHFIPPTTGEWTYRTSFREGTDVAISTDPNAGTAVAAYDNIFDSFSIAETDKTGPDFRGKGKLRYVNEHYLKFDNGEYFIKGGTDSPENLLAYLDFDGTFNNGGTNFTKTYTQHVANWNTGDPTWQNGKGKGLIGALNYLSSKGINSAYFLTQNINGDGNDVWPWTGPGERFRFDVSKLAQWNIVFDHMDKKGIMLHVQTQETENELLLDGGSLGRQRKLYYRELIARFGYHLAITWNLGEENKDNTTQQRKDFSDYISALDPYDHPIVVHTLPGQWGTVYDPLLNYPTFDGASLQIGKPEDTHWLTLDWLNKSANAGKKWSVSLDENGPWNLGTTIDGAGNNHDTIRKEVLWGNLMAGGGGVEWFFGYDSPNDHDLSSQTFLNRENVWNMTRHALDFFYDYLPFNEMKSNDALATNGASYVFAKAGEVYAVYLKNGGTTNLNLAGASGTLTVKWYDPRNGGDLVDGTVKQVNGGSSVSIGNPPNNTGQDWVALVSTESPVVTNGYGDATADGVVTALDASLILQHSIGLIILPSNVVPVIDVSGNGDVSAFDASLVLQYVVQLIDCFPVEQGCSSNKVKPSSAGITSARNSTLRMEALEDNRLRVYLNTEGRQTSSQALEVTVNYDRNLLTLEDIEKQLPNGWQVLENSEPGMLQLAVAGLPAQLEGDILSLTFKKGSGVLSPSSLTASISVDESAIETLVLDEATGLPDAYALDTNYPNPFNPATTISYAIPEAGHVKLEVFDMTGRSVSVLVDQSQSAGAYSVRFDAATLPSGMYLYRITAGSYTATRKMTLVK